MSGNAAQPVPVPASEVRKWGRTKGLAARYYGMRSIAQTSRWRNTWLQGTCVSSSWYSLDRSPGSGTNQPARRLDPATRRAPVFRRA